MEVDELVQQDSFSIPLVDLVDRKGKIQGPKDMVFSTSPEAGSCSDDKLYVLKGFNEPDVTRAEASAYLLASRLGIPVPDFALVRVDPDEPLVFGSYMEQTGPRDIIPFLKPDHVGNWEVLSQLVIFDIWVVGTGSVIWDTQSLENDGLRSSNLEQFGNRESSIDHP